MNKKMSLSYSVALMDISNANPSFDIGKLRIAYTGKNRNGSYISKNAFEDAVPSMFGCPVVVNYLRDIDEFGSHDGEFIEKNGEYKYVNITEPIGFVPPGADWGWEVVEDDDQIHQYIWTEVILWKRQEAYAKVKENGVIAQSMEIDVLKGEMCDDYYNIDKFIFEAFCLLGMAEPCFESAALFTFDNKEEFKESLDKMINEFKLAFAANEKYQAKEGKEDNMEKLKELLEKYKVKEDDLSFDIEGLSNEELEAKFVETYENTVNGAAKGVDYALLSQVTDSICEQLRNADILTDEYGSYPRYGYQDIDIDLKEVYYLDRKDWKLYGAPYTIDGDNVAIDFSKVKRMKYTIVEYIDGEKEVFSIQETIEDIEKAINETHEERYLELLNKYNVLVDEINKEITNQIFERFEDKLSGVPEFELLKSSTEVIDPDSLEEKLFVLIGKKQFKANGNVKPTKPIKAPVIYTKTDGDGEDGIDRFFDSVKK